MKKEKRIYNPLFAHEIYFKPGALESIKNAKGWKSDSELASNLGVTRQYINNLKLRKAWVTHTIIVRLAVLLGNVNNNWWIFFEIRPSEKIKKNDHPAYNLQKFNEQLPYSKRSSAHTHRELDRKVEVEPYDGKK